MKLSLGTSFELTVWRNSLKPDPPALDSQDYGLYLDYRSLSPVMLHPNTVHTPEAMLK